MSLFNVTHTWKILLWSVYRSFAENSASEIKSVDEMSPVLWIYYNMDMMNNLALGLLETLI